jgi:hypothetical protein
MMTRHWQIHILKGREQICLFVTTTSSMIDVDLDGDSEQSLIRKARQFHRHGQNEEQNHRDLAIGAIMSFAGSLPYDISDTHVAPCADVPECEANFHVGGRGRGDTVPIWEMHAAVPDWV